MFNPQHYYKKKELSCLFYIGATRGSYGEWYASMSLEPPEVAMETDTPAWV